MPPRNPYTVLGLAPDASPDTIKAAWRRLARENHPDVTSGDPVVERKATRRMAEINAAYQELRDPVKRRQHRDAAMRDRPGGDGAGAGSDDGEAADRAHGDWRTRETSAAHPGWAHPRPARPVTGRIDTSSIFHPRNTTLHPTERSPLPGWAPRPRSEFEREFPRASDPTGPTLREQGMPEWGELPELDEALETTLRFGKFEGRTLGEVAAVEPTYIAWICRTITRDPELLSAAKVVQRYLDRRAEMRRRGQADSADSAPPPR